MIISIDIEFASEAHLLVIIQGREKVAPTSEPNIQVRLACKMIISISPNTPKNPPPLGEKIGRNLGGGLFSSDRF